MKPMRTILVIAAVLLALPFWGILLLNWPLRWISQLQPNSTALNTLLAPLSIPGFLSLMALAHPTRYVVLSAMAIVAALAALAALVAAHGARPGGARQPTSAWPRCWRCWSFLAARLFTSHRDTARRRTAPGEPPHWPDRQSRAQPANRRRSPPQRSTSRWAGPTTNILSIDCAGAAGCNRQRPVAGG